MSPHSNARCTPHLGLGLGGQHFCSKLMEKIENFDNSSLVCVTQREMLYFSCIALCENTLKLIKNNTYPSRALRHLVGSLGGESICWKPMEETENVDWWCRIFISVFMLGFFCIVRFFIICMTYSNKMRGRYRKTASAIWTRRRVFWRKRRLSRSEYLVEMKSMQTTPTGAAICFANIPNTNKNSVCDDHRRPEFNQRTKRRKTGVELRNLTRDI